MKVLKIEPRKKPETIDIDLDLESLQLTVDGFIQVIYPTDDPIAIVCDEEAKLTGKEPNRVLRDEEGDVYDILCGDFLVVGLCEDDFMELTPELIEKYTELFRHPEYFMRTSSGILLVRPDGHYELIG